MPPLFTGLNRIELSHTASTNRFAWDLLKDNPPEGTIVRAHFQSEGRGQAGASWYSTEERNLTFSLIYYPTFLSSRDIFQLSKMVSLALQEVVATLLPHHEVRIKWPNDIWVERKKVAGILIENQLTGSTLKATVIGIGLNVNEESFPPELQDKATSLKYESGSTLDTDQVLEHLLQALEARYLRLRAGQQEGLDRDYYKHLLGYQQTLEFEAEGVTFRGTILGVAPSGRLRVDTGGGVRSFDVKEVRLVDEGMRR